jgi:hypothetical protein
LRLFRNTGFIGPELQLPLDLIASRSTVERLDAVQQFRVGERRWLRHFTNDVVMSRHQYKRQYPNPAEPFELAHQLRKPFPFFGSPIAVWENHAPFHRSGYAMIKT